MIRLTLRFAAAGTLAAWLFAGSLLAQDAPEPDQAAEEEGSAVDEFTTVESPTPSQVHVMNNLLRDIAEVQDRIDDYYEYLKANDCGNFYGGEDVYCDFYQVDENNLTLIPMEATVETYYGQRQRYVYNELARIQWTDDGKIDQFLFEQRRGWVGQGHVLLKKLSGTSIADADFGPRPLETDVPQQGMVAPLESDPLNLVVNELLSSGKGMFINFRFAGENKKVRDHYEDIEYQGRIVNIQVIYVRTPEQKINILREYLRLLRLLERRIDWNVRSEQQRRQNEIERVLRRDYS